MKRQKPKSDDEAAQLRDALRTRLAQAGRPTTARHIKGIDWWDQDDEPPEPWITVGADLPNGAKGDPVLAILESSRFEDMYFVATLGQFRTEEAPRAIALGKWWRVVDA